MCDLTMVRADTWRGPFVRVNDRIWNSSGVGPHPEDPFLWMRASAAGAVSFHVLLHNTPRGIHLFSADGLTFQLQQSLGGGAQPVGPFAFNETVTQVGAPPFAAARRERPWLLFERGTLSRPRALVTSMMASGAWPVVFTHAQGVA